MAKQDRRTAGKQGELREVPGSQVNGGGTRFEERSLSLPFVATIGLSNNDRHSWNT